MILWSVQPEAIYDKILSEGVYRCDKSGIEHMNQWLDRYDWLVARMKERVGDPPPGVQYPVWAWYMWEDRRKKPDLRHERWGNGWKGERFACIEIDVPDADVLLHDFDAWSIILLGGLLSYTKEEDDNLEKEYDALSEPEKTAFREKNWERVFDLSPRKNEWITRGSSVQATFWELKKEYVRAVRFFEAAREKPR